MTEIGRPGSSSTLKRLWIRPSTRISSEPRRADGEIARQGRRVVPGEDVEAGDREGVGHGLARERAPEGRPVADRPGQEDEAGDDRDRPDEAGAGAPAEAGELPRHDEPGEPEVDRLVSRQGGQADEQPDGDEPRVEESAAARIAGDAGHEQTRRQGEDGERHRRVGERRVEQERQVDRGRQPGPDRERLRPAVREPALGGDVGRQPPGQHRHDRADDDGDPLGRREGHPEQRHRDDREERRQRQPDLERVAREGERRRLVAPQRIRDDAAPFEHVPRDPDVVGGVLRLREDDLGGEDHPHDEGDDEDPERGQRGLAAAHGTLRTG